MQVKKVIFWAVAIIIIAILGWGMKSNLDELNLATTLKPTPTPTINMKLTSVAFTDGGEIPAKFTCHGENVNPPLTIADVPNGAKTLALELTDPDAPTGVFAHWIIWNMNPKLAEIAEKSIPDRSQEGTNSAGKVGYAGPCPPAKHRYFFKLFALDTTIGLDGKAKVSDLDKAMAGHIISQASLMGVFGGK